MRRKNLILLLSPTIGFALIAVLALFFSASIAGYHTPTDERQYDQKIEDLVQKFQSGNLHPTTQEMVEIVRQSAKAVHAEQDLTRSAGKMVRTLTWFALIGAFWQFSVVLTLKNRVSKRMAD